MDRQFGFHVSYYQEVFRLLQGYTSESQMIACRLYLVFVLFFCCCIILWLPGLSTSTVLLLIKKTDVMNFGNKWSKACLNDVQILIIQEVALNKMRDRMFL